MLLCFISIVEKNVKDYFSLRLTYFVLYVMKLTIFAILFPSYSLMTSVRQNYMLIKSWYSDLYVYFNERSCNGYYNEPRI